MNYEEAYNQLIQFAKSEHLLNEAKEAAAANTLMCPTLETKLGTKFAPTKYPTKYPDISDPVAR